MTPKAHSSVLASRLDEICHWGEQNFKFLTTTPDFSGKYMAVLRNKSRKPVAILWSATPQFQAQIFRLGMNHYFCRTFLQFYSHSLFRLGRWCYFYHCKLLSLVRPFLLVSKCKFGEDLPEEINMTVTAKYFAGEKWQNVELWLASFQIIPSSRTTS